MILVSYERTDVGRRRTANQDRILRREDLGLFVVCDGMGGHASGDVAAEIARDEVAAELERQIDTLRDLMRGDGTARREAASIVRRAVEHANRVVHGASEADASKRGMGTTLTLLLVVDERAIVAQVGDSRMYLVRSDESFQVTTDHTILAELTRAGRIPTAEIAAERNLNALTRAVGVHPEAEVDTLEFEVLPGDIYLLCSDGLHGYFDDLDLVEFFRHSSRAAAVENLIDMANKRGGQDNISAIVAYVGEGDTERLSRFQLTLETVKSIPLFHYLSFAELLKVIRVCEVQEMSANERLIEEGTEGADFYIVLEGEVRVHRDGAELAVLGPGRYFGEMSMVDNRPRSASVTSSTKGRFIRVSRADFYELLRSDSVLAVKILWNFIQTLSGVIRNHNELRSLSAVMEGLESRLPLDGVRIEGEAE